MPRGRPRKPRLTRMDAAVDAMAIFGFPEEKVKKTVKVLLKEYGGNDGWPFIEGNSYTELLEALLRDDEDNAQHKLIEDGNQSKNKLFEDERDVGTSSRASDTQQDERPEDSIATAIVAVTEPTCSEAIRISPEIHNGDGKGWKDIVQDPTSGQIEETANVGSKNGKDPTPKPHPPIPASASLNNIPTPPPTNSLPTPRRFPCYGWIESDEEDLDDFIFLKPASAVVGDKATPPRELSKSERKRKSRWDQSPDDP